MSRYEWERGSIIIPSDQWVAFRRGIIEAHNREQARLFDLARVVLARVKDDARGVRGFDHAQAVRTWTNRLTTEARSFSDDADVVANLLGMTPRYVNGAWTTPPAKPRAPKKADLDIRPISRAGEFPLQADEGAISFHEDTHTVTWRVSENNHACDTARSHPLGRAFFAALAKITWKRGSGGKIIGNDEYSRHSAGEGEGGNYVTAAFGPLGGAQ